VPAIKGSTVGRGDTAGVSVKNVESAGKLEGVILSVKEVEAGMGDIVPVVEGISEGRFSCPSETRLKQKDNKRRITAIMPEKKQEYFLEINKIQHLTQFIAFRAGHVIKVSVRRNPEVQQFIKNSHTFKLKILNKLYKSLPDYKKFKEIKAKSMP